MNKPYVDTSVPLTPSFLKDQIKELKAHISSLEDYLNTTKRRHRKLDIGNGTYDPIEYQTFKIMLHTSFIRSKMNLTKSYEGADGKGKQFCELRDGSMFKCYAD